MYMNSMVVYIRIHVPIAAGSIRWSISVILRGVPVCEDCGSVIRPGVSMVGEIVDNGLISLAAEEVRKADTLLVLGCNLKASLTNTFLRYFQGNELVLVNDREHFADNRADLVIHGNPMDILKHLGV